MRDDRRSAIDYAGDGGPATLSGDSTQRLFALGYITAVTMPPIGLIVGLVLAVRLGKPDSKRAVWIVILSVIAALLWILALATGLLNPNSTSAT